MISINSYSFIFKKNKRNISLVLLKKPFLLSILSSRPFLGLFWEIRIRSLTHWNFPTQTQNLRPQITSSKSLSEMLLASGTLKILKREFSLFWTSKRREPIWSSPGYNFSSTHYSWQRAFISHQLRWLLAHLVWACWQSYWRQVLQLTVDECQSLLLGKLGQCSAWCRQPS